MTPEQYTATIEIVKHKFIINAVADWKNGKRHLSHYIFDMTSTMSAD